MKRRLSPMKAITMTPDGWSRLDAIAERWGITRSATILRLVMEAEMPRARKVIAEHDGDDSGGRS